MIFYSFRWSICGLYYLADYFRIELIFIVHATDKNKYKIYFL